MTQKIGSNWLANGTVAWIKNWLNHVKYQWSSLAVGTLNLGSTAAVNLLIGDYLHIDCLQREQLRHLQVHLGTTEPRARLVVTTDGWTLPIRMWHLCPLLGNIGRFWDCSEWLQTWPSCYFLAQRSTHLLLSHQIVLFVLSGHTALLLWETQRKTRGTQGKQKAE